MFIAALVTMCEHVSRCVCVCIWGCLQLCTELRSYTVQGKKDGASSIGVVLYQRNFYVTHADETRTVEMFGRNPYPNGGMSVSWEGGIERACY